MSRSGRTPARSNSPDPSDAAWHSPRPVGGVLVLEQAGMTRTDGDLRRRRRRRPGGANRERRRRGFGASHTLLGRAARWGAVWMACMATPTMGGRLIRACGGAVVDDYPLATMGGAVLMAAVMAGLCASVLELTDYHRPHGGTGAVTDEQTEPRGRKRRRRGDRRLSANGATTPEFASECGPCDLRAQGPGGAGHPNAGEHSGPPPARPE